MEKRIIIFVKEHPGASVQVIAEALKAEEIDVLELVNDLTRDGFLTLCDPVPLGIDNDCSCYYKLGSKEYKENK